MYLSKDVSILAKYLFPIVFGPCFLQVTQADLDAHDTGSRESQQKNAVLMEEIRDSPVELLVVFYHYLQGFYTCQVVQDFFHQQYRLYIVVIKYIYMYIVQWYNVLIQNIEIIDYILFSAASRLYHISKIRPQSLTARPWKMVVGRQAFPIVEAYFPGRTVKLWGSILTSYNIKDALLNVDVSWGRLSDGVVDRLLSAGLQSPTHPEIFSPIGSMATGKYLPTFTIEFNYSCILTPVPWIQLVEISPFLINFLERFQIDWLKLVWLKQFQKKNNLTTWWCFQSNSLEDSSGAAGPEMSLEARTRMGGKRWEGHGTRYISWFSCMVWWIAVLYHFGKCFDFFKAIKYVWCDFDMSPLHYAKKVYFQCSWTKILP